MRQTIIDQFKGIQNGICRALEECDGQAKFEEDLWRHHSGGGGITRIIQNGEVFEKGGVNFSHVEGDLPPVIATHLGVQGVRYFATGVSIVIHSSNPFVPTIHMNIRYFEVESGQSWFGGGIDLTPMYVNEEDARFFHRELKAVCDRHNPAWYDDFKHQADDYFFIPHRNETRGIGGIFYDHLKPGEKGTFEEIFQFTTEVGKSFAPVYTAIVNRNRHLPYGEHEKNWQLMRRGRYVEFNLVYDRGTKFGLETSGRIESILMSLPSMVAWNYNYCPKENSPEAKTLELLRKGVDWVG
ncbi:MAG: oxygen-dependent coproporphyrinogen oxidase [Flavobacteriales bacterium]|nr:oxygen-dependent coproporphyrinogen oxidase [Flavobacteriales bacterium]